MESTAKMQRRLRKWCFWNISTSSVTNIKMVMKRQIFKSVEDSSRVLGS